MSVVLFAIFVVYRLSDVEVTNNKLDSTNADTNINLESSDIKLTKEEKEALIVEYVNVNESKGKCQQGDCDLYLKVNLPKINSETETVKSINDKINNVYLQANEYYNQDFSNKTGRDGKYISHDISYKAKYIEKYDCIYIDIIKTSIHTHASGSTEHIEIVYLVDEDKEIKIDELLSKYNITRDNLV